MHLVIIGGKSATKIQSLIKMNFDYIDIAIYNTIPDFYSTANVRTMTIDRIFLMQDAITQETTPDMLGAFNDYLGKHYPSVRIVTLLKEPEIIELVSSIFISPFMVHILAGTIKPKMLNELVEARPDILKKKYGYISTNDDTTDVLGEIVDESQTEQEVSENKENPPTEAPKKRGFFGIFGGKGKKNKQSKKGEAEQKSFEALDIDNLIKEGVEEEVIEDIEVEGTSKEFNASVEFPDDFEDEDGDIDFSVFEGNSDLGVGLTSETEGVQKDEPDLDFSAFEEDYFVEPIEEHIVEPIEEAETTEEDYIEIPKEENTSSDVRFYLDEEKVEKSEEESYGEYSNEVNTERLDKLNELKDSIFQKGINTDIEDIKTPVKESISINITDVSEETPNFDNLDDISEAYEQENVKIVEKVVETVVEKVVQVGSKKQTYKNGVRVIIFTGDRKTGVTRAAINASAYFAKISKTLYVDFDTERKGSLLYLGLESIAEEAERVQNGLAHIKTANVLPNVTHTFPKGGFDCLISMHGVEMSDEHLTNVQSILTTQREYKTLIIDCPLENLHYLEDIILYSEVLICVESDLASTLNTIIGLSSCDASDKFLSFLFNNSHYFLSKDNKQNEFKKNLAYVVDMFSLDEGVLNWGAIPTIGTVQEFKGILEKL